MFFDGHAGHADDLSRDAEQTSSVVQKQSSEKIDVDAVKEADNVSNQNKTYPDGTKSTATVPVTVIAPNVPDVIYVPKGDKVPDPSTVVTNSNDIKDKIPDTTYTWKTTPDTPNTKAVINYKANNPGTPATPVTPPVKPEQKPTTPTSNTNDDTPAPTPNATKTPAKDNGGKKTRTKNSGLDNSEKGKTNNGYVTVRPLATAMKKTVASEQKSILPQTGKKDNVALTAIGVAIAAAGSLLGASLLFGLKV